MNKKTLIALLGATALSFSAAAANADVINFSVDGISSFDAPGDPDNVILTIDLAAELGLASGSSVTVDGFGWDVTITPIGDSWYSEATAGFSDSAGGQGINVSPGAADGNAGDGIPLAYTSGGILDLTDNGLSDIVLADGILLVEFSEGFDDIADTPDSTWGGSMDVSASKTVVPVPPAFLLLASGLLSAGVFGRRK